MPILDKSHQGSGEPAVGGFAISPSDTSMLPIVPRAVYIGGAGNITMMLYNGDIVLLANVVAGSTLAVRPTKVFATGTTAANLVGLY